MLLRETPIVIVPGLRGHVEQHWQTHLAAKLPNVRVLPFGRGQRDLEGRVADLQQAIEEAGEPVLLVAHSAGCLTTLHWAARHDLPVRGALLATPPDLARPLPTGHPSPDELREHGWLPIPETRLAFPSIVAASTNDPLSEPENIRALAETWGSRLVDVGPVGHLNPASGYGEWPRAEDLLDLLGRMIRRREADPGRLTCPSRRRTHGPTSPTP